MKKDCHKLLSELARIAQSDNKESSSLLLATVKGLRFVLEQIQTLKTEISKAHIQLMEPIINGSTGVEYLQKAFVDRYGLPFSSATFLPRTAHWISRFSTLGTILQKECNEHVNSRNNGLPQGTVLRTGGLVSLPWKQSIPVVSASGGNEQLECSGGKVDILGRFSEISILEEKVFDGLVFPKTLLPPTLENPNVEDCVRIVEQNRELLTDILRNNKSILLKDFNLSTADDFSRVVEATGWEEFGYRGAVVRKSPSKRVFTANEPPLDWNTGFHHEMALLKVYPRKLMFFCETRHLKADRPPPSVVTSLCRSWRS